MIDFSMWMHSPSDWGMLFLSALLIGMSKTGIQGISLLAVPLMAMTFGAKPSTGLILPILCGGLGSRTVLPPYCGVEIRAETVACCIGGFCRGIAC